MKYLDFQLLKQYIEEEKWGHVKLLLDEYLGQPMSDADKGELYAKLAEVFLKIETKQLEATNASLQDTLNQLRAINAAERESIQQA